MRIFMVKRILRFPGQNLKFTGKEYLAPAARRHQHAFDDFDHFEFFAGVSIFGHGPRLLAARLYRTVCGFAKFGKQRLDLVKFGQRILRFLRQHIGIHEHVAAAQKLDQQYY